jgi:D-lyxose ketol-isomerase
MQENNGNLMPSKMKKKVSTKEAKKILLVSPGELSPVSPKKVKNGDIIRGG